MDRDDVNENSRLLRSDRTYSELRDSLHSLDIVFDSKMMKTSTQAGDLSATWGGRRSLPDSGRRRTRSWSGGPPDDVSSEIRILRERLVRTQARPDPRAVRHLTSRQRLTLASLALVDFISFCSMSIMAPFFPREAAAKGLSDTMSGMVFSFYAIVMFITSPVFGKFLPNVGAKFMFTAGMFVAGACNILFGTLVLINDSIMFTALCFVVRGLEALGASAYSTASYVFVVNAFPDSIGSVLGILETFVGLGMSVGPAIGGLLYSIGGFGLPFYSLGVIMVLTVPINFFLLNDCQEYVSGSKSASILQLFKIPSIIITGLVIVIVSNTWAFLDPTLEPHLRQFNLSTEQIGLIFLLFSGLYGIFSPIWGWVADRVHNHWCMMVWGLFLSSIGLLLLGPCPFIPGLSKDLWLDLVALSILGISVALTLLPTFQGVLTSSIYEGGCPEALATYSAVAGVWSCCYSLGEVLGPALGGALTQRLGFSLCATLCAAACFTMAIVTLTFFCLRESLKAEESESVSESIPYTDTTWNSSQFCRTRSAPPPKDTSPLLTPCSCVYRQGNGYGTSPPRHLCLLHNKSNKSGSASITDALAYVLKFQFLTNAYIKLRKSRKSSQKNQIEPLYQNYLENGEIKIENNIKSDEKTNKTKDLTAKSHITAKPVDITAETNNLTAETNNTAKSQNITTNPQNITAKSHLTTQSQDIPINNNNEATDNNKLCSYLEEAIFGSPVIMENVNIEHLKVKKNKSGLVPNMMTCDEVRSNTDEMLKHNVEKVHFYEQSQACYIENIFDGCECRDGVTFVPGTITVSSTGACEV